MSKKTLWISVGVDDWTAELAIIVSNNVHKLWPTPFVNYTNKNIDNVWNECCQDVFQAAKEFATQACEVIS